MKKLALSLIFSLLAVANSFSQISDALKVRTFTLDNGLTVWINEDPNQVAVYGAVVVKAGAVDCPGTGIAHYFEHMMFKGTDKIGTTDYAAEKPYLDSISAMYDKLALSEDEAARKDIQMEINRLSIKASDYAIPNEFNNLISEMGGSGLNAFTSYDETVYHNKFLPEYFEQWAELNSERIMNPVFRLFQSELETVYEEKNMGNDELATDFRNAMLRNIYKGTGYTEEIVGTTENLKNPRLAQMREFFEKYYVASNMGLILTGNIRAEEAMPVIEKSFGRIRRGEPIVRDRQVPEPISGVENVTAMIDMPIVRLNAVCFNGPSKTDEDFLAVSFMTSLLNNDAGTGMLDKLMVDHKLMVAQAMPDLSFKDAGSILVLYMPKLLFQKEKKATKLVFDTFEALKKGDFTDEYFESCKLSYKKMLIAEAENLTERMQDMAFAFSEGLDWNEILERPAKVDAMTKEDIVAIANKYLCDNYILIHKKKGTAQSNKLQKPDYEKITPKNREASSEYATQLRASAAGITVQPRRIDYQNDAETVQNGDLMKVYAVKNPYNNVFDLTLRYNIGTTLKPDLERVAGYVNTLGTDTESFDEIRRRLQTMGSNLVFSVSYDYFDISMSGFDENLDATIAIAADLMKNVKGDKKKLSSMKTEEKSSLIMSRSDMGSLDQAIFEKALYGEKSSYLAQKGEFKDEVLLGLFRDLQKVECDVLYSGTLTASQVNESIARHIDVSAIDTPAESPVSLETMAYDSPQVFFVSKKKSSQSQIRCIVLSDPLGSQYNRYAVNLYADYLGGGMSSVMFQEIREFRSMAYSTGAGFGKPLFKDSDRIPGRLIAYIGTQCDKTIDAMNIVDSLVMHTPFMESKLASVRKEMLNERCNQYPYFRAMPSSIVSDLRSGYTEDPVDDFIRLMDNADTATLRSIWEKYVAGRNAIWTIVGDQNKLDMQAIGQFGTVTILKPTDIIR